MDNICESSLLSFLITLITQASQKKRSSEILKEKYFVHSAIFLACFFFFFWLFFIPCAPSSAQLMVQFWGMWFISKLLLSSRGPKLGF